MFQAQRMYTNEFGDTFLVMVTYEETIGLSLHNMDGEEVSCCHGSKSPAFPEDLKLSKKELIEKDGYDCDEMIDAICEECRFNYSIEEDTFQEIYKEFNPEHGGASSPGCAFGL